jgi:hypothetical protein
MVYTFSIAWSLQKCLFHGLLDMSLSQDVLEAMWGKTFPCGGFALWQQA